MTFESFHGSPGSPNDFSLLEPLIKGKWVHHDRQTQQNPTLKAGSILVGYSWGCRELFRTLEQDEFQAPRKIILLAPFHQTTASSPVKKFLLGAPLLSHLMVSLLGGSIIDSFIKESSLPENPSPAYLKQKYQLQQLKTLRSSVFEKDIFSVPTSINKHDFLIIWGEGDQTSSRKEQLDPILDIVSRKTKLETLPGAGHALVWNQSQALGKIINSYLKK